MGLMRASLATLALVALSACGWAKPDPTPGDGIHDPAEDLNRQVHRFNIMVDDVVIQDAGEGLTDVVPEPVFETVSNFADTLSLPRVVVNQVLQGRLGEATQNAARFSVNATLGFGGLADVATDFGLPEQESDFGETMAVWGVPEGGYVVLPFIGPSTERDAVGQVVDLFINPFSYVLTGPESYVGTVAEVVDDIGDRGRYSNSYDSVLHESADSYKQVRLIYLQNRRHELGEEAPEDDIDPLALDTEGF